jgi:hypothetical protein
MYNFRSFPSSFRQSLNILRRDRRYKKYKIQLNKCKDTLVKVIYKCYSNLFDIKLRYMKLYKSFVKYLVRRYRFYDAVTTKIFTDFVKFFVDKTGKDKSVLDIINSYIIFIFCYGLLINIGLGVFDIEMSIRNVLISGVWFYFIKEELCSYILLLVRGVRQ